ncbi:MAG TPA: hypothetical protein DGG94_07870, partial [Micromonosporaceae bacterium]|nr:hypothetical protein [Micromonosporaceae bacterium]
MANQIRSGAAASPYHHGSHRHLLSQAAVVPRTGTTVDAIIVPTARRAASLQKAIDLAARLGCPLVALCSKWALTRHAAWRARQAGIELVAIPIKVLPSDVMPFFKTTDLLRGTRFERKTDTSLKRNLGLLFARLAGWERIVFLDDDIAVPDPHDLRDAVRLLDSYAGVGLSNGGFPDNSVVCHAFRQAGGLQETFVGGGALAVKSSTTSFFPNIYNEDWFFLLDEVGLRRTAVTGRAIQQKYDPFRDGSRARSEEFGDCLAEGVFWLLDRGQQIEGADAEYWRGFLDNRYHFITEVIDRVRLMWHENSMEKERMITALKASRGRSKLITPSLCVAYLDAWREDRARWQQHVDALHSRLVTGRSLIGLAPEKALAELGLHGVSE